MIFVDVRVMCYRSRIKLGSRVYMRNAVCGDRVLLKDSIDSDALWLIGSTSQRLGRLTTHDLDTLIVDELFKCKQFCLEFDRVAA